MRAIAQAIVAVALLAAVVPLPARAQPVAQAAEMTEAEVRKVDKENRKITLRHGPIRNLDMPAMTMVFGVTDAALLDRVQAGDKIRFRAAGDGGKFTVVEIQPLK